MDASERDDRESPGRPRVVDKRVSARPETPAQPPPAPEAEERADRPSTTPPAGPHVPVEPTAASPPADPGGATEPLWTPEQEEQARRFAQEIRDTPSRDWVLNAAVTLVNVAATKLDAGLVEEAQVAIDALSGIVDAVGARLGETEAPLRHTVAQLKMAYAQVSPPPTPG